MSTGKLRQVFLVLLALVGGAGSVVAQAAPPAGRIAHTAADVQFMSGMIGHHAQAVIMGRMAVTHGASAPIRRLAERIVNAQEDEIATMQRWLRDRGQPVPEPFAAAHHHGAHHAMPGMLSEAQLRQLDQARGAEFDRLFLRFMIQHHQGAVGMVEQLFGTNGAAQDPTVFDFASDVHVDQTTEVARMQQMLVELLLAGDAA